MSFTNTRQLLANTSRPGSRLLWASFLFAAMTAWLVLVGMQQRADAAVTFPIPLHTSHVNKAASFFSHEGCKGFPLDIPQGSDGWHFVLPGGHEGTFASLTLSFVHPETNTPFNVVLPGGPGSIDGKHAFVVVPQDYAITAGLAQASYPDGTVTPATDKFNVSHTCLGKPTTPSSPPPSSPAPSSPAPSSPAPSESGTTPPDQQPSTSVMPTEVVSQPTTINAQNASANLPITGVAVTGYIAAAIALLAGGIALVVISRRRMAVSKS